MYLSVFTNIFVYSVRFEDRSVGWLVFGEQESIGGITVELEVGCVVVYVQDRYIQTCKCLHTSALRVKETKNYR